MLPVDELDRPVHDVIDDGMVVEAVAALPPAHRSVVVLRFYLDWDVARIASALDVAPGTVKSRLHRALARLRIDQEVHR